MASIHYTMKKIVHFSGRACVGDMQDTTTSEPESYQTTYQTMLGHIPTQQPLPGRTTTDCINFRHWMWMPNTNRNVTFVARCCCFWCCMIACQLRNHAYAQAVRFPINQALNQQDVLSINCSIKQIFNQSDVQSVRCSIS